MGVRRVRVLVAIGWVRDELRRGHRSETGWEGVRIGMLLRSRRRLLWLPLLLSLTLLGSLFCSPFRIPRVILGVGVLSVALLVCRTIAVFTLLFLLRRLRRTRLSHGLGIDVEAWMRAHHHWVGHTGQEHGRPWRHVRIVANEHAGWWGWWDEVRIRVLSIPDEIRVGRIRCRSRGGLVLCERGHCGNGVGSHRYRGLLSDILRIIGRSVSSSTTGTSMDDGRRGERAVAFRRVGVCALRCITTTCNQRHDNDAVSARNGSSPWACTYLAGRSYAHRPLRLPRFLRR